MGDRRIRIEKSQIAEGKFWQIDQNIQNLKIDKIIDRDFFICLDMRLKAIEFVQQRASRSAKFQDVDLAKELKKLFDETFFPTWQCIVGKNFGSDISFEADHMLYFHFNSTAILLWKAG